MGAGPRSREMQFVHLNGGKKRQTKNIKMYFFALARESRLSTDRSIAIFAHTLFCPIPSHLNSILKSWARTSAPLHGFWVHNFATSNTHTHTHKCGERIPIWSDNYGLAFSPVIYAVHRNGKKWARICDDGGHIRSQTKCKVRNYLMRGDIISARAVDGEVEKLF